MFGWGYLGPSMHKVWLLTWCVCQSSSWDFISLLDSLPLSQFKVWSLLNGWFSHPTQAYFEWYTSLCFGWWKYSFIIFFYEIHAFYAQLKHCSFIGHPLNCMGDRCISFSVQYRFLVISEGEKNTWTIVRHFWHCIYCFFNIYMDWLTFNSFCIRCIVHDQDWD